jgi:acyl carrier protein
MTDALIQVVAQTLNVDPSVIGDDSSPENTNGWDSAAAVRVILAIEKEFALEFTLPELMAMHDVGLIRSVLRKKGVTIGS